MKRIRNAAMLTVILAISSPSQADTSPTTRAKAQMEDTLTSSVQPNGVRTGDPDEQHFATGLDYTQESRFNDRNRAELRQKARTHKEYIRSAS